MASGKWRVARVEFRVGDRVKAGVRVEIGVRVGLGLGSGLGLGLGLGLATDRQPLIEETGIINPSRTSLYLECHSP